MDNMAQQIKNNWMIILFLGSLIVTWTTFSSRLANAENEIEQLSQVVNQINQMNITIAVMAIDIQYIKENIK